LSECTKNYKVILIDNGSTEDIHIHPKYHVEVIRNEENLGFPRAINQGFKIVDSEFTCILNNDTVVTPRWAERLIAHLDNVDLVGPRSNMVSGMQQTWAPVYRDKIELYQVVDEWKEKGIIEVNYIIGLCMMFKSKLIKEVGEFDEIFGMGNFEERDWCRRAVIMGYKIGIAKDCWIHHYGSRTFELLQIDYGKLLKRNAKLYLQKYDGVADTQRREHD
jgi:GT2 family glycosyltransferase